MRRELTAASLADDARITITKARKMMDSAEEALNKGEHSTEDNLIVAAVSIGTAQAEIGDWCEKATQALERGIL